MPCFTSIREVRGQPLSDEGPLRQTYVSTRPGRPLVKNVTNCEGRISRWHMTGEIPGGCVRGGLLHVHPAIAVVANVLWEGRARVDSLLRQEQEHERQRAFSPLSGGSHLRLLVELEAAARVFQRRTVWRIPSSAAASPQTSSPQGQPGVRWAFR